MAAPFLGKLYMLVEDILNDLVPETPRDAVLARVRASFARAAGNYEEMVRQLAIARQIIGDANGRNWRDVLRANVELGIQLTMLGRFDEAVAPLQCAYEVLDRFFGVHNAGAEELKQLLVLDAAASVPQLAAQEK